jgi:hypothetical protein
MDEHDECDPDRRGLFTRRRSRRYKASGTALSKPSLPNDLWCTDYKGEFMFADKRSAIRSRSRTSPAVI